ncbi:hypothetical protein U1Q18_043136, partial [Sarracenia purpurea var. burkii]
MDNDQSPFRNLPSQPFSLPENYDPFGADYSMKYDLFDQSLEDTLAEFSLFSEFTHGLPLLPADLLDALDVADPAINCPIEIRSSPLSFRDNGDFRLQNTVNGQMGFQGTHRNPTMAADSGEGFWTGSYPTAASHSWRPDDGVSSCIGFHQERDGSFLGRKKQTGNQLSYQFPIVPCSYRKNFFTESDQHFVGLTDDYSFDKFSGSRPKSFTRRLLKSPHYWNCFSLEDLRGQMLSLAIDQNGCKLLQKKLESPKEEETEMVMSELILYVDELMRDPFGNFVISKLVKACNQSQRTRILLSVTKTQFQLPNICLNQHGAQVVRRLLECITSHQQISLVVSALYPCAAALVTDPNGQIVIKYCVEHFSNKDNKAYKNSWGVGYLNAVMSLMRDRKEAVQWAASMDIVNEMAENCFEIATSQSGYCVLQLCVDHSEGEYRERLVYEIIANALRLSKDRYGNFVVQHLLDLKIPEVTENLLRQLKGSYVSLSCNKYASNVVENCLIKAEEEQASQIILELLSSPKVSILLVDPFGNFVIQKALSVSK